MSLYDNKFMDYYNYLFTDLADVRTNDWPLINSPVPGLTIIGAYLYFVLSWGPKYMSNRKPFKLERLLIAYNLIQVLVSLYIFFEGMEAAWLTRYSWRCQPVDTSTSPEAMREARGVYAYFLAKISELLDTVFFVLRKKDRQITFLHLYHHTVMPMISWGATKYYPGGHGTFIGVINSFVHIIMYTYYLFAAMGPFYQKYLWWKKYITNMQMIQFCLAFLHSAQLVYTDCGYPRWSVFFTLPNAIFFYFLFNDFYRKSYTNEKKLKSKNHEEVDINSNNGGHIGMINCDKLNGLQENGKSHKNGIVKNGDAKNGQILNGLNHLIDDDKQHKTNGVIINSNGLGGKINNIIKQQNSNNDNNYKCHNNKNTSISRDSSNGNNSKKKN